MGSRIHWMMWRIMKNMRNLGSIIHMRTRRIMKTMRNIMYREIEEKLKKKNFFAKPNITL